MNFYIWTFFAYNVNIIISYTKVPKKHKVWSPQLDIR